LYLAEIHGKLSSNIMNKEDVLTSNVFSFFKYSNRTIFFSEFLKLLDIHISPLDAKNAVFDFWPRFIDGTEPDVVIHVGEYYILIEAKYHSGFGQENQAIKHQLFREYEGGNLEANILDKKFVFVIITADLFNKPNIFEKIPASIKQEIKWINWQAITILIEKILLMNPEIDPITKLFAEDFFLLLQKKGFRNYIGLKKIHIKEKINMFAGNIFFDIDSIKYLGVFQGFITIFEKPTLHFFNSKFIFFKRDHKYFNIDEKAIEQTKQEIFFRRI
jgi:hypothetical protein